MCFLVPDCNFKRGGAIGFMGEYLVQEGMGSEGCAAGGDWGFFAGLWERNLVSSQIGNVSSRVSFCLGFALLARRCELIME